MWTSWQSRLVDGGRLGSVRHTVVKTHFYSVRLLDRFVENSTLFFQYVTKLT